MPTFRCTSKRNIEGKLPKGATVQVLTPNGVFSVNAIRIKDAIKQQLGIDLQQANCVVNNFDVVKIS